MKIAIAKTFANNGEVMKIVYTWKESIQNQELQAIVSECIKEKESETIFHFLSPEYRKGRSWLIPRAM